MRDKMTKEIRTAHEAIVDYRTRKYLEVEEGSPEEICQDCLGRKAEYEVVEQ